MTRSAERLGVIAGGGKLPRLLIDTMRATGAEVRVVALKTLCDPQTPAGVVHRWLRLGQGGRMVDWLRQEGVARVVMAGRVVRPRLWQLWPDWPTFKFVVRHGYHGLGDNRLLEQFERTIARRGLSIVGALDLAPSLAAPGGPIAGPPIPDEMWPTVHTGIAGAVAHGAADLGQAVVAREGKIIAREERAGTDAMLAGLSGGRGRGGVLVKLPKPQQVLRLDPPVVGLSTLDHARDAGLSAVVLAAGRTLLLDRDGLGRVADEAAISVYGADRDLLDRVSPTSGRPAPDRPDG